MQDNGYNEDEEYEYARQKNSTKNVILAIVGLASIILYVIGSELFKQL